MGTGKGNPSRSHVARRLSRLTASTCDVILLMHLAGPAIPYDIKKLTPNLIVSSVEQSLAFYCDVLGFTKTGTVPGESPFVFAMVQCDYFR